MTKEERAEISRRSGAKSKGPATKAGKEHSKRNAIKHGEYADALKHLVPPDSALLVYEDRREFFALVDANTAKFRPADDYENALVREITDLQWANLRARVAIIALVNREIVKTGAQVQPLAEETFVMENILAAYEALGANKALLNFRREYRENLRSLAVLERRLHLTRKRWPAEKPASQPETQQPKEGTQPVETPNVANTEVTPNKRVKIINVQAPLTEEKIRLYKQVFPKRELQFNVFENPEEKAPPKAA